MFLNHMKFVDPWIMRLSSCEKARRVCCTETLYHDFWDLKNCEIFDQAVHQDLYTIGLVQHTAKVFFLFFSASAWPCSWPSSWTSPCPRRCIPRSRATPASNGSPSCSNACEDESKEKRSHKRTFQILSSLNNFWHSPAWADSST